MYKKIDGHKIADRVKDQIVKKINSFSGLRPNLAIILVGEREDSKLYVSLKEKEGKKVGVDIHTYRLNSDVEEKELISVLKFLNKDELIDGVLVQLPLPKKFNTNKIINNILPVKDVDGFRLNHPDYIVSPVVASIKACLDEIKFKGDKKLGCILSNSDIFAHEIKKMILDYQVKIVNKDDLRKADLVITAIGKAHYLKKEMIKKEAVVIDIGISKQDNKVLGDADPISLKEHISFLTPVPGGIGPMTIAFLFKNVLEIFCRRHNI
jgi:methylenetetrahydrofolate dehydrogenase (NADP+) / methenyltetrahydrofolate cyclohydrolase